MSKASKLISLGDLLFAGVDDYVLNAEGAAIRGETPILGQSNTFAGQTAANYNFNGRFSISNWSGYPNIGNVPKPTGSFRILEGAEYDAARNAANSANSALRRANPELYKGLQIHEIHPVKFGGSPTDIANKIALPRQVHTQYTNWWNSLQRNIKR